MIRKNLTVEQQKVMEQGTDPFSKIMIVLIITGIIVLIVKNIWFN